MGEAFRKEIQEFGLEAIGRYYSSYRGFIADNKDPEFKGRLKLKVPQLFDDEVIDYWAWSKGLFSGTGIGLFAIPNIGDMVWVSFEGGDPRFPIWEYGHWAKGDVISGLDNDNGKPNTIVFQSTTGHRIEIWDVDGQEKIKILNRDGFFVELNAQGVSTDVQGVGKKIHLGTLDNAAEPALLGDKTEDVLNEIKVALQNIQTMLNNISTADTVPAASLSAFMTGLFGPTVYTYAIQAGTGAGSLATNIASLTSLIALIKSQKVRLD